ncbi:hypothetical protein WL1483_1896 [Aeromonas schubertii]|uniref:Uncharacterized protein n=1 Tax=Aeromonas schubertii TaxID=652 RepID=A0A0S2SHW4_9GAMM|nr:hypothetical protein WL1483_1896 [Aeromonas schubertii]
MSSERRRSKDGPSARTVGLMAEARALDEGERIGGVGLSFGDFSLATQRKVTRHSPQGRRNPFEEELLASHAAQPHREACHRQGAWPSASKWAGETPMRRSRIKGLAIGKELGRAPSSGWGKAFLVTFLWPRKEKSLATARRAGKTPSRRNSSRPMRRSRIERLAIGKELARDPRAEA